MHAVHMRMITLYYNVRRSLTVSFQDDVVPCREVAATAIIAWPLPPAPTNTLVRTAAASAAAAAAAARRSAAVQQQQLQQQLLQAQQQERKAYMLEAAAAARALPSAQQELLIEQHKQEQLQQQVADAHSNELNTEANNLFPRSAYLDSEMQCD
jgi:hypothetical protein